MLKVMIDLVQRDKPIFGENLTFWLALTLKPYNITLKLTTGECLNIHYVRTKFRANPSGSGIFCVDLTWNDNRPVSMIIHN